MIEFKKAGKMDFMGFTPFKVYKDGKAVTHRGVEIEFNALSVRHCFDMWNQTKKANERLGTKFPDSINS